MNHQQQIWIMGVVALAATIAGCATEITCARGASVSCACADGTTGSQLCESTGSSYTVCDCSGLVPDAGLDSDGSMNVDAGSTNVDAGTTVDAGAEDAFVAAPCVTDTAGQPGELLCIGVRASDAAVLSATAEIGRDEPMLLLPFVIDGNVYLQVPLRMRPSCGDWTPYPDRGEAWSGSLMVTVTVNGADTSFSIDVEPLVPVADTPAGDVTRGAFEQLRDVYTAAGDTEAATNFEAARLGIETAQTSGQLAVFGFGNPGCIPVANCDCGPAVMTATQMSAIDAFLAHSWTGIDMLSIPLGAGGGGMPDRLARCEESSFASLRCALGFAAIAIIADRPTDAFLAAAGAVIYVAGAFTLPAERIVASAVGAAKYYTRQLEFYAGQASALRHTTSRTLANPMDVLSRFIGASGFSEDEIPCGDCRSPSPSGAELDAAGCGSAACGSFGDCGCTGSFGCRGYAAGGGYCGACIESAPGMSICIPTTCVYENTWFAEAATCPARCDGMSPACH